MSARGEAGGHGDRRDDLATYALGALDQADAVALEAHLASCAECRRYLEGLRGGVEVLGASVPQLPPPPELRARLLDTVRAEAERVTEARRPAPRPRRRWRSWRGLAARPATAIAAAVLLIAGLTVGYLIHGSAGTEQTVIPAQGTAAAPPGSVNASLKRVDGSGTLMVKRMPPLHGGDVYEVWTQRGTAFSPESTFVLRRDGTANAAVPNLEGASAVLVTREPHGGSAQPTSKPLVRADLAG